MTTGTPEEWAYAAATVCVCGHHYDGHINGKGPCDACMECNHFRARHDRRHGDRMNLLEWRGSQMWRIRLLAERDGLEDVLEVLNEPPPSAVRMTEVASRKGEW